MKTTIDQKLVESQPDTLAGSSSFVSKTMEAVKKVETTETFSRALRSTSVTNKESIAMKIRNLQFKFNALPRFAAVAIVIGSTGTVGAAAYATYQWIVPSVTVTNVNQSNDDHKKEYTINSQCGEIHSGKALHYELSQNSKMTEEQILAVFKNTCAYDALQASLNKHWVNEDFKNKKVGEEITQYQHQNLFAGSTGTNPIFGLTLGNVTSISATSITIELPLYSIDNSLHATNGEPTRFYYPEGKIVSRTLPLTTDAEVIKDGKQLKLSDVAIGDQVQLVIRTKNLVQYYSDIHDTSFGEQTEIAVAGIVKTDLDTKFINDAGTGIGNPLYTDALSGLKSCYNNPEYYCVQVSSQLLGSVYQSADETNKENLKYLRKDVNDKNVKVYQIDGRITKIEGTYIQLEARVTKKTINIELPYDAIAAYNKPKPIITERDKSESLKVEVGDLVDVSFSQAEGEDHQLIKASDIQALFLIEQTSFDGTITKF